MFKKILNSKITLAFLILIIIFLAPGFYRNFREKNDLEKRIENINEKAENIVLENLELEKEISLEGDEEGAEEFLRRKYILKKPGEKALVMPKEFLR